MTNPGAAPATGDPDRAGAAAASWATYYGALLLGDGLAAIPRALYLYQGALGLSAQQVWFVACLLAQQWTDAAPGPALSTLAVQTGVAIRTLQYLRAGLQQRGWLGVTAAYDQRRGQASNRYDLAGLLAALETAIAADPAGAPGAEDLEDAGVPGPGADASFLGRYGRVVLRRGVAAIPRALYRQQGSLGLSPQQVWFVSYILAHQVRGAYPYPSLVKMAARTGYTPKTLHVLKASLVGAGYLVLVGRVGASGGQETNGYDWQPLFAALSRQIQQERAARVRRDGAPPMQATLQPPVQPAIQSPVQATTQTPVQATTQPPVQTPAGGASSDPAPGASGYPAPGANHYPRVDSGSVDSGSVDSDAEADGPGRSAPPAAPDSPAVDRTMADEGRVPAPAPRCRGRVAAPAELVAQVRAIAGQLEALAPPAPGRQPAPEIAATAGAILDLWAAHPEITDAYPGILAAVLRQTRHRAPAKPVGYFLKVLRARLSAVGAAIPAPLAPPDPPPPPVPPATGALLAETITGLVRVWRLADDPGRYLATAQALWQPHPALAEADLVRQIHALVPATATAPAGPARMAALLAELAAVLGAAGPAQAPAPGGGA